MLKSQVGYYLNLKTYVTTGLFIFSEITELEPLMLG